MKKALVPLGMAAAIALVVLLARLDGLLAAPLTTPTAFLASMPHIDLPWLGRSVVLIQPSSTILVYLLGLVTVAFGLWFLRTKRGEASRGLWGIGLVLWGLGALAAGTSYQAFGYVLKGEGRPWVAYTSDFELVYLLLTCWSIDFLVAATARAVAEGKARAFLASFAWIHAVAYTGVLLVGAVVPVRFLISYEGFMAMNALSFLLMFGFSVERHRRRKDRPSLDFIGLWLGFLGVNLGYFAVLFSGIPARLYERSGVWFNENDTLHVLLLAWMVVGFLRLDRSLKDAPDALPSGTSEGSSRKTA